MDPDVRGFIAWESGPSIVADVGRAFLAGYEAGLRTPQVLDAGRQIQRIGDQHRGFAMEGLGMAAIVRDGLTVSRPHTSQVLARFGETHGYMLHVGIGWGLARLPRMCWPDLSRLSPLLGPLALDGFGFHEVFFNTREVLSTEHVEFPLATWPGPADDAAQELMQGLGRGLWFVCGGQPESVAEHIGTFDPRWRQSLWSGIGLACSYAGGVPAQVLHDLTDLAGDDSGSWLRQGSAFAAEARLRSDTVVPHTHVAARELCGQDVESLSGLTRRCRPSARSVDEGDWTVYEAWRSRIAEALA